MSSIAGINFNNSAAAATLGPDGQQPMPCTPLTPKLLSAFDAGFGPVKPAASDADSAYTNSAASSEDGSRSTSPTSEQAATSTSTATAAAAACAPADAPAPARVLPQIERLTTMFATTTAFSKCVDPATGCTKPCCIAATAFLEGATMAASARLGIPGVLDVLQTKFKWGSARCWTLCQAMKQKEVDCGAGVNLALMALTLEPSIARGETKLVKVQTVKRWKPFNAHQRRSAYQDKEADADEHAYLTAWIEEDCYYHQQVGLARPDGSLRIWDYGEWHQPPTDWTADRAHVAIKLTPVDEADVGTVYDWLGLAVPSGEWVSLLPATVAIDGLKNVEPLPQSLTHAAKRAILGSVFAPHSLARTAAVATSAAPSAASTLAVAALAPEIYIGGNHMSANPCPGVGVSRAIRLRFPAATTVAVDAATDSLSGMNDSTFSRSLAVNAVMMPNPDDAAKAQHFELVSSLLHDRPEAMYLPCSDAEIDRVAEHLAAAPQSVRDALGPRVLCPPPAAVDATEKPGIRGAKAMGIFEIPAFMTLDAASRSQTDVEEWCKVHGYPVLVKGPVQGATVCHRWSQVLGAVSTAWGSGGYVQVSVTGFQMGLAYAAYDGELTAAVLMEKTQYVGSKAWGGKLRPVPPVMLARLRTFCREHNWTGGGELEYIETFDGKWHAIDWNPRFPAWIFGGTYAGVNLPAALIQHALSQQTGGAVPFPADVAAAATTAHGGFTRTCVEIPTLHTDVAGVAGFPGFATTDYSKAGHCPKAKAKMNMLPPGIKLGLQTEAQQEADKQAEVAADEAATDAEQEQEQEQEQEHKIEEGPVVDEDEAQPDMAARSQVQTELNRLIPESTEGLTTPRFVLSRETVREQLYGHKAAVERALAELENPPALKMCLSAKTQPHPAVLAEARAAGYLGEVITSAEMHACLDAGWAPNEIVMNGPGKWYGDVSGPRSDSAKPKTALRCLFADSLADLRTIVARIQDPSDWLDAEIVGVRFSPAWVSHSRFGLNCKDPQVLLAAAELISSLPDRVKVGLHMHFAASKLGVEQWFGVARGYLRVAANFVELIRQDLSVLDFGGGWPSHLLDHEDVHPHLVKMLSAAQATFPGLEAVQFEPGKSITERAGAVLTKVIEIREMERKTPDTLRSSGAGSGSGSDSDSDEADGSEEGAANRAAVVDACISDMGSMPLHVHPLVWQEGSGAGNWSAMEAGKDQLWGSICMEFDVLGTQFKLPKTAAVGDHVLIAFTGAYDTTMAYDFADGKARDMLVV